MKQYIIINNTLKMSKGKVARVCATAGMGYKQVSTIFQRIKWFKNMCTTVVLKCDDIDDLFRFLDLNKIKYKCHIDAGRTQVEPGSICMVTFFCDGNNYLNSLKLY